MAPRPYPESWEELGENINSFLENNAVELNNESFDVLLGFTRGGMIIATILSCQIRDKVEIFPNYKEPHKASIRPIPSGISSKRYQRACFAMDQPAHLEEINDFIFLLDDLKKFQGEIIKKTGQKDYKLNVLLIDDNLTGSTRLNGFKKKLSENIPEIKLKTLCYTRPKKYRVPPIDYCIRSFPEEFDYFVMPYHEVHDTKAIEEGEPHWISFIFDTKSEISIQEFSEYLRSNVFGWKDINQTAKEVIIERGLFYFVLDLCEGHIKLNMPSELIYPPKLCLSESPGEFDAYSLCELGAIGFNRTSCQYCSLLNCNKDILDTILNHGSVEKFSTCIDEKHETQPSEIIDMLFGSIYNWFINFSEELSNLSPNKLVFKKAIDDLKSLVLKGSSEHEVQKLLGENAFLFGLNYETIIPQDRAGKKNIVDFLLFDYYGDHEVVEIKRPDAKLIHSTDTKLRSRGLERAHEQIDRYKIWYGKQYIHALSEDKYKILKLKGKIIIGRNDDKFKDEIIREKERAIINNITLLTYDDFIKQAEETYKKVIKLSRMKRT